MNIPNKSTAQPNARFRRYYHPLEPLLAKPKNRVYTATVLSFLTVSLFVWYAIRPTLATILSLRREIRDNVEVNRQMEEKISSLVEAQATYQSIASKLPLLESAIPQNPEILPLLIQLRKVAEGKTVNITGIAVTNAPLVAGAASSSATPAQPNASHQFIPFGMSVDGAYQNIRAFLTELSQLRRIITFTGITIHPVVRDQETDEIGNLRLTVSIEGYYRKGP